MRRDEWEASCFQKESTQLWRRVLRGSMERAVIGAIGIDKGEWEIASRDQIEELHAGVSNDAGNTPGKPHVGRLVCASRPVLDKTSLACTYHWAT
jgi:hypothetical protein